MKKPLNDQILTLKMTRFLFLNRVRKLGSQAIRWMVLMLLIITMNKGIVLGDKPLLGMDRFENLMPLGSIAPKRSETIEQSRWGVQMNMGAVPSPDLMLERAADSGVKWVRLRTSGYESTPPKGYWDWQKLDQIVRGLADRKIHTIVCITTRSNYTDALGALVKRYSDIVKHWELLNEPEIDQRYADLVKQSAKVIKNIDTNAVVIAGDYHRSIGFDTLERFLQDYGAASCIDVLMHHPYDDFPESSIHRFLTSVRGAGYAETHYRTSELRALLAKQDQPIELWQGECGFPSSEYTDSWKNRGPWGEYIQAKWLLRRFLTDFALDMPVTIYYMLHEPFPGEGGGGLGRHIKGGRTNAKGLLRYPTWDSKPAYRVLQHLTSVFDERLSKPKTFKASFTFSDEGSFYGSKGENVDRRNEKAFAKAKSPCPIQVVGATGPGGDAVAYWLPWRMQEFVKPAKVDILVTGADIKDPVLVDLLTGQIYRAQTSMNSDGLKVLDIPLADYPMLLVGKSAVKEATVTTKHDTEKDLFTWFNSQKVGKLSNDF
jgi:hypothetical protein